jgi:hypothetical protein
MFLLGIAGVAGLFVIADNTLLSKASAGITDLGGLVTEVKKAQSIAASLDSGDPDALQGLLDALVDDQGITPGEASPDLFGLLAGSFGGPVPMPDETESTADGDTQHAPAATARRVTMIVNSSGGGLAMIDGTPLRAGETRDGMTLVAVHEDSVVVRENGFDATLSLR